MVKVITPFGASAASGSIGGDTYARNQYGQYVRNRTSPTQPDTSKQTFKRTQFAAAVARWNDTLTAAQREAWRNWAARVPQYDTLGRRQVLGGFQAYMRVRMITFQTGLGLPTEPPPLYRLESPDLSLTLTQVDQSLSTMTVTFDGSHPWTTDTGAALVIHIGKPHAQTVNFFNGPWQRVDYIEGDATSPPSSPYTLSLSGSTYTFTAGLRTRMRAQIIMSNYQHSAPWISAPITIQA